MKAWLSSKKKKGKDENRAKEEDEEKEDVLKIVEEKRGLAVTKVHARSPMSAFQVYT